MLAIRFEPNSQEFEATSRSGAKSRESSGPEGRCISVETKRGRRERRKAAKGAETDTSEFSEKAGVFRRNQARRRRVARSVRPYASTLDAGSRRDRPKDTGLLGAPSRTAGSATAVGAVLARSIQPSSPNRLHREVAPSACRWSPSRSRRTRKSIRGFPSVAAFMNAIHGGSA